MTVINNIGLDKIVEKIAMDLSTQVQTNNSTYMHLLQSY